MRAILLIVLLHSAMAQQSEEVDRRVSRLEARIQQLEQAVQLAAQHPPGMEDQMKCSAMLGDRMAAMEGRMTAMLGDRMSAMEGRMAAQMTSNMERMTSPQEQNQSCDIASSIVRDFSQLHLQLLDRDSRAVESQLLEMRQLVQSAVGDVSATEERIAASNTATEERIAASNTATEERIASANLATEERLASNVVRQIENMTSQMEEQKERINDLEHRTTGADCKDLLNKGFFRNGVFTIRSPDGGTMKVYCDMENDGGGWTDFLLGWQQYAAGFGNLRKEFWL
ncbi:hypothetical protein CAPTEDRAFT_208028, partial [Capitella teleta]